MPEIDWEKMRELVEYAVRTSGYYTYPEHREECINDILVELWTKRDTLRTDVNLAPFVCRLTRWRLNHKVKSVHARQRRLEIPMSSILEDMQAGSKTNVKQMSTPSHENAICDRDEIEQILKFLFKDRPYVERIWRMHHEQGLSIKEIADELSIKAKSVDNLLQAERKRLAKHFRDQQKI